MFLTKLSSVINSETPGNVITWFVLNQTVCCWSSVLIRSTRIGISQHMNYETPSKPEGKKDLIFWDTGVSLQDCGISFTTTGSIGLKTRKCRVQTGKVLSTNGKKTTYTFQCVSFPTEIRYSSTIPKKVKYYCNILKNNIGVNFKLSYFRKKIVNTMFSLRNVLHIYF